MLPKPVTALALSAFVSIASLTATSAVAAQNPSSESSVAASSTPKGAHHVRKDGKKSLGKKKAHLASLHGAEPKELAKLPASLSTHLDLKTASDRPQHASSSKKPTLAATGKEVFIGGPTVHGAKGEKADKSDKAEHASTEAVVAPVKGSGKLSVASTHSSKHGGPMSKAGRAPARPDSAAAKTEDGESGSDDHPVRVALRDEGKGAVRALEHGSHESPCLHEAIEFVRGGETERFPLTRCDGASAPLAVERLSVLVRPEGAARPGAMKELAVVKGQELAPGIRRIDAGLIGRVQSIVDHFAKPGMPARVAIVSGYRPGSTGSFHASAQALDFHLEGVPNEAVVDYCKTLENTGCGYYPNSSFVHVDVRAPGAGHVAWIDASGPGEPPQYVTTWPPPPEPDVKVARDEQDMANPYTKELEHLPGAAPGGTVPGVKSQPASLAEPLKLKDWE